MRVVLLTTPTTHHLYFAWKLAEQTSIAAIVLETEAVFPPFDTFHPFEAERDAYERTTLLAGGPSDYGAIAEAREYPRLSSDSAVRFLRESKADAIIVFGTRRLPQAVIDAAPVCLNLHGGDPRHYRGLDTHLWAVYHGDFQALVTTLHVVEPELDAGGIVSSAPLAYETCRGLHELRAVNTKACVSLSAAALATLRSAGSVPAEPQTQRGRYYSFMPSVLKDICVRRFRQALACS